MAFSMATQAGELYDESNKFDQVYQLIDEAYPNCKR
jgi:hypothetical protein